MKSNNELPVVFVRALVVFPGMSVTLTIGREASRLAILNSQQLFDNRLVALTQLRAEDQEIQDLTAVYTIGTICKIERVVELTDGGMQVQVEGIERFEAQSIEWRAGSALVKGRALPDTGDCSSTDTALAIEKLSSYQPVHFDKTTWIEGDDPKELERINNQTCIRQKILEESAAQVRLRLLQSLDQEA
jgi:ATP-dependent Lon protease